MSVVMSAPCKNADDIFNDDDMSSSNHDDDMISYNYDDDDEDYEKAGVSVAKVNSVLHHP